MDTLQGIKNVLRGIITGGNCKIEKIEQIAKIEKIEKKINNLNSECLFRRVLAGFDDYFGFHGVMIIRIYRV
jgi:hypothetical protein